MRIGLICTWTFRTERRQSANNLQLPQIICAGGAPARQLRFFVDGPAYGAHS
jgi:hypothetical protein